jgi:hypothetical protein
LKIGARGYRPAQPCVVGIVAAAHLISRDVGGPAAGWILSVFGQPADAGAAALE